MKIRLVLAFLCISTTLMAVSFAGQSADPSWEAVGDGIGYQEFHLTDPLIDIYVARMDLKNTSAILDSGLAQGRIFYGAEKVSDMFKRYDDAINFWGESWGKRNKVVVAINGSYFGGADSPESGQVTSGWYAKRFTNLSGSSGFGFHMDRSVFIGQCVYHDPAKQVLKIARGAQTLTTLAIDGVNTPRAAGQLVLYTPQYDSRTHTTTTDGLEVLVEMKRPSLIISQPAFALGTVRKILDHQGGTLIPFDHVVLSASGARRSQLLANLQTGDEIQISQEITSYDKDCNNSYPLDWKKTYASVSGGFNNLREGQVITTPPTQDGGLIKAPRTAIAFNDQYVFYIVVDGRTQQSVGMTYEELAAFSRDTLGATWATTQDGGGSSAMVVNGQVKNHPVSLCAIYQYLPLILNNSSPSQPQAATAVPTSPAPADPNSAAGNIFACERLVANTMMMINVQPALWSLTFHPSDPITLQSASAIRLGPGTNYAALANLPAGTQGVILPHVANLNGISAKGTSWWKAAFGNIEGWVDERSIQLKTH